MNNSKTKLHSWKYVSKEHPCVLCGKPDWCSSDPSGEAVRCCRSENKNYPGWRVQKYSADGFPIWTMDNGKFSRKPFHEYNANTVISSIKEPVPISINEQIKLETCINPTGLLSLDVSDNKITAYYDYGNGCSVMRTDKIDPKTGKVISKVCIPRIYDETKRKVINGKGDNPWLPYRIGDINHHLNPKWVLWVEGEKCVEASRMNLGVFTTTVDGSSWNDTGIIYAINCLISRNIQGIIYMPDNDEAGRKKAQLVEKIAAERGIKCVTVDLTELWHECPEKGDIYDWIEWGREQGLDIKSFKTDIELEASFVVDHRITSSENKTLTKLSRKTHAIRQAWGQQIRYNELKNDYEFLDNSLNLDNLRVRASEDLGIDISISDVVATAKDIGQRNAYNPVTDYLVSVSKEYIVDSEYLDSLADDFFGASDPLHAIYFKKTLVASVARALDPGCQVDTMLILSGKQGFKKSTFWRDLTRPEWFTDDIGDCGDKDELMKLYKHWFAEIAEFEVIYRRKDASQLKRFITSRKNDFRMPYERSVLSYPRRCVLVGTTNETEFLNDPTGSRRFWIIPVNKEIPTEKVSQLRDKIWAAAYHLYKDGFQWWLTEEEDVLRGDYNKQYEKEDNWTGAVLTYVKDKDAVRIPDILLNCVNKHLSTQEQKDNNRVAAILRRDDWKQVRKRESGVITRVWVRDTVNTVNTPKICGVHTGVTPEISADTGIECGVNTVNTSNTLNSTENRNKGDKASYPLKTPENIKHRESGVHGVHGVHTLDSFSANHSPAAKFKVGEQVKYIGGRYHRQYEKLVTITLINKDGIWVKGKDGFPVGCCDENELQKL